MLNFSVGPVMSDPEILKIGSEQVPYFRTSEFSELMKETEKGIKQLLHADDKTKAVFLTGSGSAAMEAAVMNTLNEEDKALVISGGSFGDRFAKICEIHNIPHTVLHLEPGQSLTKEMLEDYSNQGYTALLVNICETSTGVKYDPEMLSDFCKKNHLFWIMDAVSGFLADPLNMKELGANVVLTGSQKALAIPPGVSIVAVDEAAQKRIEQNPVQSLYLDLKDALKNMERGQTPFTPAVSTLLMLHKRVEQLIENGGAEAENKRIAALCADFKEKISDLPLDELTQSPSNCVTALKVRNCDADEIFQILKDEYGIWICPNGGDLKHTVFRVGHLGYLSKEDNTVLSDALHDLQKRGILK